MENHDDQKETPSSVRGNGMKALIQTLISDRLLELSRYVTLDVENRTIMIDQTGMRSDGYQVITHPLRWLWGGSDLNEKVGQKYLTIYKRHILASLLAEYVPLMFTSPLFFPLHWQELFYLLLANHFELNKVQNSQLLFEVPPA